MKRCENRFRTIVVLLQAKQKRIEISTGMQEKSMDMMIDYERCVNKFFAGYFRQSLITREEIVLRLGALLFLRKINALTIKSVKDDFEETELVLKETVSSDKVLCYNESLMKAHTKGTFGQLLENQILECMKDGDPDCIVEMGDFLIFWDVDGKDLPHAFDYAIAFDPHGFGQIKQSRKISELAEMLLDKSVRTVFDPFGGLMDFATTIADRRFVANEINVATWEIGMFRLAMVDLLEQTEFRCKDSADWEKKQYDAIVTNPPFGTKLNLKNNVFTVVDAEDVPFRYFNSTTNENGQLITVVPMSFLSSDNTIKVGLREMVVNNNWLDTVIYIPKQKGQRATSYIDYAIVVLSKNRATDMPVRFVDASCCFDDKGNIAVWNGEKARDLLKQPDGEHSITVSSEVVIENHSLWLPGYYLFLNSCKKREGFEFIRFADVLEPVPAQRRFEETFGRLVAGLSATVLRYEMGPDDLPITQDLDNTVKITEPVVLISMASAAFPMYCVASEREPIFVKYSRALKAYRLKRDDIHVGYLCTELFRRLVSLQNYVNFYLQLTKGIFDRIPLSFPLLDKDGSFVEQQNLYEETKEANQYSKVRELGLEGIIDSMKDDYLRDIHSRKHAMSQNTSALAMAWDSLLHYLESNNGAFDMNDVIGRKHPVKVGGQIKTITMLIKTLDNQAFHLTEVEYDWGDEEDFYIQDFISEYIKEHQSTLFSYEFDECRYVQLGLFDTNGDYLIQNAEPNWKLRMPKNALRQVIDNIVSNAVSHGFVQQGKDYCVGFEYYYDVDDIVLEVSNNGEPMNEEVDTKFIRTYGSSTKLNEKSDSDGEVHSGIGGYDIYNILNKYGAEFEVFSTPDQMQTVLYRIIFHDVLHGEIIRERDEY